MRTYKYHQYIDEYFDLIKENKVAHCKEQKMLVSFLEKKLNSPNIVINSDIIYKSVEVSEKYFRFKFYPWEKFLNAFIYGVRYKDGRLVFDRFLILLGRGSGKNGFISPNALFMMTSHHGIQGYDIDIVANSEDQAKTSFNDIYDLFDMQGNEKLKTAFYRSKVLIKHKKTMSKVIFNTSNTKTKDSKRTGAVIFDEVHMYDNYEYITTYISGLGKRPDPREFYITTDGHVRGGVLDDLKEQATLQLHGETPESTLFPFICKIDEKEEADNPDMWVKAIPSLPYNNILKREIKKQYGQIKTNDRLYMEFFSKRMNYPLDDIRKEVATYEERLATDKPMPVINGRINAVGGVDYASKKDFCSCGLLFKHNGMTYFKQHTFIFKDCIRQQGINEDIINIAVKDGFATLVENTDETPEIPTEYLVDWFNSQLKQFSIHCIACDLYRSSVIKDAFTTAGYKIEIVRKGNQTHSMLAPIVQELFSYKKIAFSDDAIMRWYVGNVYKHLLPNGNTEYLKIEAEKRKTDGFFAFLHALNISRDYLKEGSNVTKSSVKVVVV